MPRCTTRRTSMRVRRNFPSPGRRTASVATWSGPTEVKSTLSYGALSGPQSTSLSESSTDLGHDETPALPRTRRFCLPTCSGACRSRRIKVTTIGPCASGRACCDGPRPAVSPMERSASGRHSSSSDQWRRRADRWLRARASPWSSRRGRPSSTMSLEPGAAM